MVRAAAAGRSRRRWCRGTLVYVEATLRPQGAAREGALAAAGKILGTSDPEGRIRRLLDDGLLGHGTRVDFARDVKPWLGDRADLWAGFPAAAGWGGPPARPRMSRRSVG